MQKEIQNYQREEGRQREYEEKKEKVEELKGAAEKINRELLNRIKKGDDKNVALKLQKMYSEQNRKLARLEQELREQRELEQANEGDDEEHGLLQRQDVVDDIDVAVFKDNTQERKQRLFNAHKSLSNVKNVFQQIAEIATSQVDQMYTVEQNFGHTEQKTK